MRGWRVKIQLNDCEWVVFCRGYIPGLCLQALIQASQEPQALDEHGLDTDPGVEALFHTSFNHH